MDNVEEVAEIINGYIDNEDTARDIAHDVIKYLIENGVII